MKRNTATTQPSEMLMSEFGAKLNKKYGSYSFWIEPHPHKYDKDTTVFYNNVGGLYFKMGEWVKTEGNLGRGYDLGDK